MSLSKSDVLAYLSENKEKFLEEFNLTKLGLFGSFAEEWNTEESDIDIMVDFKPDTPDLRKKKDKIKSLVGSKFGRDVDVCTEKYIKHYYRTQILQSTIYV